MDSTVNTQVLMSIPDYLEHEKTCEFRNDYVGGVLYPLTGTSKRHNVLLGNFFKPLVTVRCKGCHIFANSVKLHPTPDTFYYPDLMFTCEPSEDEYVVDEACLVVEILSESTEVRDRFEKWAAYKQMDSLQHYLLVHQDEPWIEHFQRDEAGQWQLSHHHASEIALKCPEMSLRLTDIYVGVLDGS
jgi:Uma2 family endonuclease